MISDWTAPPAFTTRPTLEGTVGMAASTHWAASGAAMAVLERGGNAFDAAVAAGFVLQVVEPHLNGPGGDLVAIFTTRSNPAPRVLDGQGWAPARASAGHYRALGLDRVPGAGALAAAVPGATDAWLLLLRDFGTWDLADVAAPAIDYARRGFPASAQVSRTITTVRTLFDEHWKTSAALWLPDGRPPRPGQLLCNPGWAEALRRLCTCPGSTREGRIEAARAEWATGFVAEAVDRFCTRPHRHANGADFSGVLTGDDMAAYRASIVDAAVGEFRGYRIAKTPAWGQGPALLITLAILDGFDDAELDPSSEAGAHLVLEATKLALADREAWFGESLGPAVSTTDLLDPAYVRQRRALIGESACGDLRPGRLGGRKPQLPTQYPEVSGVERAGSVGEPTVSVTGESRGDTCHVDVVDRWGNMVSATPSGGWLQSSPTVPELGFALGTRLQMTWLEEGLPSTLAPGRRPRTTLTPTLVLRDEHPLVALGSPGGDQQDQWQLLYLLRTLVGRYEPQQAIDAPAFHTTSAPSSFWPRQRTPNGVVVEDRLNATVIAGLSRRGHQVTTAGDWSLGRLSAVGRDARRPGVVWAAANPRGMQGYAVGR